MRGDDLLLTHLAVLPGLDDDLEEGEPRPTGRERLEAEVGVVLARELLDLLPPGRTPPSA
jgi:hypothetical protein